MFGPLSRAGGTQARRARRKIIVIVGVVIIVGFLLGELVDQVATSQSSVAAHSDATYVAALVPMVSRSNALVPVLDQIRDAPTNLSTARQPRAQLDQLTEELVSGAASITDSYANLGLAPPSPLSASLIVTVFAKRGHLSIELKEAVDFATGGEGTKAGSLLAAVGSELKASDIAYRSFLASLPRGEGAAQLPSSSWSSRRSWSSASLGRFVALLSSSTILAGREQVKILAVSLDPPAVSIAGLAFPTTTTTSTSTTTSTTTTSTTLAGVTGSPGTFFTTTTSSTTTTIPATTTTNQIPPQATTSNLPATPFVAVTVVIKNTGNIAANGIVVSAALTQLSGPEAKSTAGTSVTRSIDSISVGGSRYLGLGRLHTEAGALYVLTVSATPRGGLAARDTVKLMVG